MGDRDQPDSKPAGPSQLQRRPGGAEGPGAFRTHADIALQGQPRGQRCGSCKQPSADSEARNYGEIFVRDNVPVMVYLLTGAGTVRDREAVPAGLPRPAEHELPKPVECSQPPSSKRTERSLPIMANGRLEELRL